MGGTRGRMISTQDRIIAVELIDEAVASGARLKLACEELNKLHIIELDFNTFSHPLDRTVTIRSITKANIILGFFLKLAK